MPEAGKTLEMTHGQYDQVRITDHDHHVFFMGLGAAIKACKRSREREIDFNQETLEMLLVMEEFAAQHGTLYSDVAIRPEEGGLCFYFASRSEEFDVELSRGLAELESKAAAALAAIHIRTRQVSAGEFEEIRKSIRQYADTERTHQPVEAQ
jgi:hypothetical protein